MKNNVVHLLPVPILIASLFSCNESHINRHALVTRHNLSFTQIDNQSPMQVGNGDFAFGADITGLQTFYGNTMSSWGWHSSPLPEGKTIEGFKRKEFITHGRKRYYMYEDSEQPEMTYWLFHNPHRINLGKLRLRSGNGTLINQDQISGINQKQDLWKGLITSRYKIDNEQVEVLTAVHPDRDAICIKIHSALLAKGDLTVSLEFPYGDDRFMAAEVGDWTKPDRHLTGMDSVNPNEVRFVRTLDKDQYEVIWNWTGKAGVTRLAAHTYVLKSHGSGDIEFVLHFSKEASSAKALTFNQIELASSKYWKDFWLSGGAVDLSQSKDPRWFELERRIVLSQFIMAVNASGSTPPQESGLYQNGWCGKFHLEMTMAHGMHFMLWNRPEMVRGYIKWFHETGFPAALREAKAQGWKGAKWMKMLDNRASWEVPAQIDPLRLTQQGHAIYWMEELYRMNPVRQTLLDNKDIVFESASYMADFVAWDDSSKRYILGPPVINGAENTDGWDSWNPAVELSYWVYGLETAQQWRTRLGMQRDSLWDHVLNNLSSIPLYNGIYIDMESHPQLGSRDVLHAFGLMPGTRMDPAIMDKTYRNIIDYQIVPEKVTATSYTWGTGYKGIAITGARLGHTSEVMDYLMKDTPHNFFKANGVNTGGPDATYIPGNGALLWTIAWMCAGWEGGPERHAPGFPDDGQWTVKYEGLRRSQ